MTGDYHIRLATPDDVALMVQHRRLMFEAMGQADVPGFEAMLIAFEAWARRLVPQGEYVHWCIDDAQGFNVGGGGMYLHGWIPKIDDLTAQRGYIANVYVDPAHRRQGLARQLLGVILTWSRAQGLQHVTLHASEMGRPLYEALGFVNDGMYLLALSGDLAG